MKTILIALFLTSLSSFAYDIQCTSKSFFGFNSYNLVLENIDLESREGTLRLSKSGEEVFVSDITIVSDYLEGSNFLTIETRDMSVSGFVKMDTEDGSLEINNKEYNLSNCDYVR